MKILLTADIIGVGKAWQVVDEQEEKVAALMSQRRLVYHYTPSIARRFAAQIQHRLELDSLSL